MKEKIINYIETLEAKAYQSDDYFKQRNELYISIQEKDKEIERLKEEIDLCDTQRRVIKDLNKSLTEVHKEKDRLKSIIKEVREYINKIPTQPVIRVFKKELLEILDKVGEGNE